MIYFLMICITIFYGISLTDTALKLRFQLIDYPFYIFGGITASFIINPYFGIFTLLYCFWSYFKRV